MKENTRKNTSHLIHVNSIPDNCVQITHYGKHQFDNLYFCKSNNKLYQKFEYRIREIPLFDENGEKIIQETRKWDDEKGKSFSMRSKEDSQDYRYFPDPDLLTVKLDQNLVKELKEHLPLSQEKRIEKYISINKSIVKMMLDNPSVMSKLMGLLIKFMPKYSITIANLFWKLKR